MCDKVFVVGNRSTFSARYTIIIITGFVLHDSEGNTAAFIYRQQFSQKSGLDNRGSISGTIFSLLSSLTGCGKERLVRSPNCVCPTLNG
jgi:hypothetical protein